MVMVDSLVYILFTASSSSALRSFGSAPAINAAGSSSGAVQLKNIRPLNNSGGGGGGGGGITLLSSRSIDTGYGGAKISSSASHLPGK